MRPSVENEYQEKSFIHVYTVTTWKKTQEFKKIYNNFLLSPSKIDVDLQHLDLCLLLNDHNIVNMK